MTKRTLGLTVTTLVAMAFAPSSLAMAQSVADSSRVMLYLAVGGGGETELETDPASILEGTVDNEATVGVGARFEAPLMDYLSLGAMVDLLSYEIDGADRRPSGHFDLWAKARYVVDMDGDLALEAYLGVPVGFSVVAYESSDLLKREKRWLGWNIGALLGAQLFFTERFGAMLEAGWRRFQVYNETDGGDTEASFTSNQFAFNMGGVFLF